MEKQINEVMSNLSNTQPNLPVYKIALYHHSALSTEELRISILKLFENNGKNNMVCLNSDFSDFIKKTHEMLAPNQDYLTLKNKYINMFKQLGENQALNYYTYQNNLLEKAVAEIHETPEDQHKKLHAIVKIVDCGSDLALTQKLEGDDDFVVYYIDVPHDLLIQNSSYKVTSEDTLTAFNDEFDTLDKDFGHKLDYNENATMTASEIYLRSSKLYSGAKLN